MAILTVGLGEQFAKISDAIAAPQNGDAINVDAGTYVNDYVSISKNITLQGIGGMIKLVSIGLIPNGKAIFITSGNITIDNFEFSGATVSDGNPQSPDELDWFILLSRIPRMKWHPASFARQFQSLDQALTLDQAADS